MEDVDKVLQKADNKAVLGVYAKQPVPGRVKTRLCPPLTPQQAAELYRCSLRETVTRMRGHAEFDLLICYDGERSWFEQAFPGVELSPQQGEHLGARMANSFLRLRRQGYRQVVLIGSDAPDLPLALVQRAFAALQRHEVVLAPAEDGGYVLIGQAGHRPELFEAIPWGSGEVWEQTLTRIEASGIQAEYLDGWMDLDDIRDLDQLLRRSPQSATACWLQQRLPHVLTG